MAESEVSLALILFLLCEFFVGAIVGASIGKDRGSAQRGMAIALALAMVVFAYGTVVFTLATQRLPDNPILKVLSLVGAVFGSIILGFCPVLIFLLFAAAGYWSGFVIFRHFGIGPNRITLASIFAFMTVLAAVAALIQLGPRPPG